MKYYVYILFSEVANKYYVGYSPDPQHRLIQHNSYQNKSKFTAKYQPWILKASFAVNDNIGQTMKVEKFIKDQKSRAFIQKLIDKQDDTEFIKTIIIKATL
ncbi:GIY-YIG nuclease family protein [Carboxylicivirga taeanensis]|uniref:GIY-YIG nuclease family protein n=1 Tax=Carboxylicivirga taeanensis TaxID=1416875 RepID=UPI003F6DB386